MNETLDYVFNKLIILEIDNINMSRVHRKNKWSISFCKGNIGYEFEGKTLKNAIINAIEGYNQNLRTNVEEYE